MILSILRRAGFVLPHFIIIRICNPILIHTYFFYYINIQYPFSFGIVYPLNYIYILLANIQILLLQGYYECNLIFVEDSRISIFLGNQSLLAKAYNPLPSYRFLLHTQICFTSNPFYFLGYYHLSMQLSSCS